VEELNMDCMDKQATLSGFTSGTQQQEPIRHERGKPQTGKKRLLSASSINTYLQCPRRFFYQYIQKLPTAPSIYLIRGSLVHSTLEDFYDFTFPEGELHVIQDKLQEQMHKHFLAGWEKKKDVLSSLGLDEKTLEFFFDESLVMISNWLSLFMIKAHKRMQEKNLSFSAVFAEMKPEREVYYRSEKMGVHGYIDAIHEKDGNISIIDYKTSRSSELKATYKLQLGLYALLYQEKNKALPDEVGIFFLKDDEILIKPDEQLVLNALEKLQYVKTMTKEKDISRYPMKPSKLCKWSNGWSSGQCDFYEQCYGR